MNNAKTGELIAAMRKKKNMTQQNIADELHVTSKAVSKWERGLSFPSVDVLERLACILGVSITDILAGEIVETQSIAQKAEEVSIQALKKEKRARRKSVAASVACILLLLAILLYAWGPSIFQRGNPLPYLAAGLRISEARPFVEVRERSGIYISKRGSCPELLEFIKESRDVEFVEQAGSGYLFTNGVDSLVISSEVYWGWFTVWSVPQTTLEAR